MLSLLAIAALGFSLDGPGRRLDNVNEACKAGCDAGHDASCDEQDASGAWTRDCDMHPTTSCDEDCHHSPPPPLAPWLGEHGTYPSPPPPPPPVNNEVLIYSGTAFLIALAFLCCMCVFAYYGSERGRGWDAAAGYNTGRGLRSERVAYWCCCLLSSRRNDKSWHYDDERERKEEAALAAAAAQQEEEELGLINKTETEGQSLAVSASGVVVLPSLNLK